MPLSDQDKQRIREEEQFRIQVRKELAPHGTANLKKLVFWVVLATVAILLYTVIRTR